MICPFCGYEETKVLDTRDTDENTTVRRRRVCLSCDRRFTTYEKVEHVPVMVVKNGGKRELFSREKILTGILRACDKTEVSVKEAEKIAEDIECESRIETLVKAKGFEECIAVINDGTATVIVKTDDLLASEVAQINEIVYEQSGILPTGLKIIEKN